MKNLTRINLLPRDLVNLLQSVRDGSTSIQQAVEKLSLNNLQADVHDFARLDLDRHERTGLPEVIYCQGKTEKQVAAIAAKLSDSGRLCLATRASETAFQAIVKIAGNAVYHREARIVTIGDFIALDSDRQILVVSAGTSDLSVSEEAAITAEAMGNRVERLYDVGVAGIHRLLNQGEQLKEASVVIVVAGMEGALPSVVGGLVHAPVVAVPTSVGYGANFEGLAALLAMLNSCAPGIAVVNIDNGFGAGCMASKINRVASRK